MPVKGFPISLDQGDGVSSGGSNDMAISSVDGRLRVCSIVRTVHLKVWRTLRGWISRVSVRVGERLSLVKGTQVTTIKHFSLYSVSSDLDSYGHFRVKGSSPISQGYSGHCPIRPFRDVRRSGLGGWRVLSLLFVDSLSDISTGRCSSFRCWRLQLYLDSWLVILLGLFNVNLISTCDGGLFRRCFRQRPRKFYQSPKRWTA